MDVCLNCGGAIGEPGKAYGYAGNWCHCPVNPAHVFQRPARGQQFNTPSGINITNTAKNIPDRAECPRPTVPSKKECLEAAAKFVKADHCKAAFYKGTRWLKEYMSQKDEKSNISKEHVSSGDMKRLSEEKLVSLAEKYDPTDHLHPDCLDDEESHWYQGYRACEDRILGKSPASPNIPKNRIASKRIDDEYDPRG